MTREIAGATGHLVIERGGYASFKSLNLLLKSVLSRTLYPR
jgi:hypothetical protein